MDDLSLCKKIADIEGIQVIEREHFYGLVFLKCDTNQIYNPLTDDALCFQLMVKYKINFESIHTNDGEFVCYECLWRDGQFYKSLSSDNANKAICLAIIEANKGVDNG